MMTGARLMVQRMLRLPYATDRPFMEKCEDLRVSASSVMEKLVEGWVAGTYDVELTSLRRARRAFDDEEQG